MSPSLRPVRIQARANRPMNHRLHAAMAPLEPAHFVLARLPVHQIHRRGRGHAMLADTAAKPPQLDEFIAPIEAHLREAEACGTPP